VVDQAVVGKSSKSTLTHINLDPFALKEIRECETIQLSDYAILTHYKCVRRLEFPIDI